MPVPLMTAVRLLIDVAFGRCHFRLTVPEPELHCDRALEGFVPSNTRAMKAELPFHMLSNTMVENAARVRKTTTLRDITLGIGISSPAQRVTSLTRYKMVRSK